MTTDGTTVTSRSRMGCIARVGFILLGLLALVLVLAVIGSIYESVARSRELGFVGPPGQRVDVATHRLHIVCSGQRLPGESLVVLEAGVGGWSAHWSALQKRVAEFARVCSYDRAGMGWSDPGPQPRDGHRIATELHALLELAGERPPYALVGASRGGQYARLYRDTYPEEVSGMLLLDAESEEFRAQSAFARNTAAQNQFVFSTLQLLTSTGLLRLLGGDPATVPVLPCLPSAVNYVPDEERGAYMAVEGQPKCFDAVLAEEAANDQREAQVREAAPLGDLPLIVVARGAAATAGAAATVDQAGETERIWRELQQELAGLSTHGTLVEATASGHEIARDQPELVIELIRQLLATA